MWEVWGVWEVWEMWEVWQYGSVSAKSLILPSPPTPLSCRFFIRGFPPNKKTTRQRGAGARGDGGVRAALTEPYWEVWENIDN
jgi:hypothetical protein